MIGWIGFMEQATFNLSLIRKFEFSKFFFENRIDEISAILSTLIQNVLDDNTDSNNIRSRGGYIWRLHLAFKSYYNFSFIEQLELINMVPQEKFIFRSTRLDRFWSVLNSTNFLENQIFYNVNSDIIKTFLKQ